MYLSSLGNVNPASCPEGTYPASYQMAIPLDGPPGMPRTQQYQTFYECKPITGYTRAAPPPAPAQITVTVPTQTTVSPQVSPQFIQQQQPTNSPIGAELVGPREGADAEALAMQARAQQNDLLEALRRMSEQSAQQPQQVIIPNTTTSGDGVVSDQAAMNAPQAGIQILPLLLIAAVGVGIIALSGGKNASRNKRGRKR